MPEPSQDELNQAWQGQQAPSEPSQDDLNSAWAKSQLPEPDLSNFKGYVRDNLKRLQDVQKEPVDSPPGQTTNPTPPAQPRHAEGFLDAMEAGWQMSTAGLISRGKLPDTVLPQDAGFAAKIGYMAGQVPGDLPAMIGAGLAASETGPVGSMAAAWAAPAGIRKAYVDSLQKGGIKDFGDFFSRAAGVTWEMTKGAVTGAATSLAGPLFGSGIAKSAAELATMTTVGKAMEGQVPSLQDFAVGAVALGGFHVVGAAIGATPELAKPIQEKLQNIYAKTGIKPEEVATAAQTDPVLKQEVLSSSPELPSSLKSFEDPSQPGDERFGPKAPPSVPVKAEGELGQIHDALNPEFTPKEKLSTEGPGEPPEPPDEKLETPKPEDEPRPEDQVLERIGESSKVLKSFDYVYGKVFNGQNEWAKLGNALMEGHEVPDVENPVKLGAKAAVSASKADYMVKYGPFDYMTGEPTGTPGLMQTFNSVGKENVPDFLAYAISKRSIELEGKGINTGVPQEAARAVVENNASRFEKPFRDWVNFHNDITDYAKDAGLISEKSAEKLKSDHQDYIPMNRILPGDRVSGSSGPSLMKPIKEIHGSDLELRNPMESSIRNTFQLVKSSEKNRAIEAAVALSEKTELGQRLMEKQPIRMKPTELSPEETARILKDNGVEFDGGDPVTSSIFRPQALRIGSDEVAVMRDGKPEVYKVGEAVAKSINADPYSPNTAVTVAGKFSDILRRGAVDLPDFLLRHATRDTITAYTYSKNGFKPVYDTIDGLHQFFKDPEAYRKFIAGGGGLSTFVDMDEHYLQNDIFKLSKETGMLDRTWNIARTPLDLAKAYLDIMGKGANAVITAPKLAEFSRAVAAGKDIHTAGSEARDVTIDNATTGSSNTLRALSRMSAFWKVEIQGTKQFVEKLADPATRYQVGMRAFQAVTIPSLLLWSVNKDNPKYQNAPNWLKNTAWRIPLPGDNAMWVPKPFAMGVLFGSLPERLLDKYYSEKPEAFKDFANTLFSSVLKAPIPNLVQPVTEQWANKSLFTGHTVVPDALSKVAPAYQYTPYTSNTAKLLAHAFGYIPGLKDFGPGNLTMASPLIVQNYVRAWTGGTGNYVLQMLDKALEKAGITPPSTAPENRWADDPFLKSFLERYPSMSAQPIQDFYDNLEKTRTHYATMERLQKQGPREDIQAFAQDINPKLEGISQALGKMRQVYELIYLNPSTPPADKRQQLDWLNNSMIDVATQGNKLFYKVRKNK